MPEFLIIQSRQLGQHQFKISRQCWCVTSRADENFDKPLLNSAMRLLGLVFEAVIQVFW